jgi:hypothetical protein
MVSTMTVDYLRNITSLLALSSSWVISVFFNPLFAVLALNILFDSYTRNRTQPLTIYISLISLLTKKQDTPKNTPIIQSFHNSIIHSFHHKVLPSFMKSVKSIPAGRTSFSGTGSPAALNIPAMVSSPSFPALSASITR